MTPLHASGCLRPTRLRCGRALARATVLGAALVAGGAALAAQCSVSTTGMAFGSYSTFASAAADSTGSVTVACDATTGYSVAIGTGGAGTFSRALSSGAKRLGYNLYTDASRTLVWGDGTGSTSRVNGAGLGAVHTVYGRVPARQNVAAGSYADAASVTVEF